MSKKSQSENEDDPAKKSEFKGFVCPLRSATKEVYCVHKGCQLWVPYTVQSPEGPATSFECAWWVLARYSQALVAHLSGINNTMYSTLKKIPSLSLTPEKEDAVSLEDIQQHVKDRYPEIQAVLSQSGMTLQGYIEDKETRDTYFKYIKGQGFKFHGEGPVKYWYRKAKSD